MKIKRPWKCGCDNQQIQLFMPVAGKHCINCGKVENNNREVIHKAVKAARNPVSFEEENPRPITVEMYEYFCHSCGRTLRTEIPDGPVRCARCKSEYWKIPVEQRSKAGRPRKKKEE